MRTLLFVLTGLLTSGSLVPLAQPQSKGGEDETGPYEVVEGWPKPWANAGYIWGSQPGVFAESGDRIFILARGELKLPDSLPRGFNGIWGSLGQRATEPRRKCAAAS